MNFTYKDLYASANFTYSYGAKRLWDYAYSAVNSGAGTYNAYNYLLENGYVFTRDPMAAIPRMGLSYVGAVLTEDYIFDASFIKLTALNVNYRLPKKWFEKRFLTNVDITFQASNLFTITNYPGFDPQGNFGSTDMAARYVVGTRSSQELIGVGTGVDYSTYPSTRTFSLGLKLTFK